jgi:hypothetical protein
VGNVAALLMISAAIAMPWLVYLIVTREIFAPLEGFTANLAVKVKIL